ncbi:hypothetical protein [Variovorax sp. dw_954]|uniref:hypothetical protein n=1 Tax=Variovorax sp. dw_954 TaxID=2720078 RepID=UPI001BD61890|nr:hypothetical protein [Variovorax sp. dw_954]
MNATSSSRAAGALPRSTAGGRSAASDDPLGFASSVVGVVDAAALDRIDSLVRVQQARLAHQQRSATDAVARLGAQSAPASASQALVAATATAVGRLQMVQQQIATPAPSVPANGWVLHGRVYDASFSPRIRQTVYLVDDQNRYVGAHGYAYTDQSGYFLLRQTGPDDGQDVADDAGSPRVTASRSRRKDAAPASSDDLFVAVADMNAQPVHLASSPFMPSPGKASYRSIVLAPGGKPIGDPPDEVRAVAIPPIKPGGSPGGG